MLVVHEENKPIYFFSGEKPVVTQEDIMLLDCMRVLDDAIDYYEKDPSIDVQKYEELYKKASQCISFLISKLS